MIFRRQCPAESHARGATELASGPAGAHHKYLTGLTAAPARPFRFRIFVHILPPPAAAGTQKRSRTNSITRAGAPGEAQQQPHRPRTKVRCRLKLAPRIIIKIFDAVHTRLPPPGSGI